jgi:hypothetical protein
MYNITLNGGTMYKGASDSQHFVGRKGSHSTKGSRGGKVTVLPPEAEPHEQIFLELSEQMAILEQRRLPVVQEVQSLMQQLSAKGIPEARKKELRPKLRAGQDKLKELRRERSKLYKTQKYAGLLPYCIVFYYIARERMDPVLFEQLDNETSKTMGRKIPKFNLNAAIPGTKS